MPRASRVNAELICHFFSEANPKACVRQLSILRSARVYNSRDRQRNDRRLTHSTVSSEANATNKSGAKRIEGRERVGAGQRPCCSALSATPLTPRSLDVFQVAGVYLLSP